MSRAATAHDLWIQGRYTGRLDTRPALARVCTPPLVIRPIGSKRLRVGQWVTDKTNARRGQVWSQADATVIGSRHATVVWLVDDDGAWAADMLDCQTGDEP